MKKQQMKLMALAALGVGILSLSGCKKDAEDVHEDVFGHSHANTVVALSMRFSFGGTLIDSSRVITDGAGRKLKVEFLKFYMSAPSFTNDEGGSVAAFPNKYLLWSMQANEAISNVGEVDGHLHELHVALGIDSATNHGDPVLLQEPLIDPNMWWGWAPGHKFLIMEGRYDSNNDQVVDQSDDNFVYHCGMDTMYTPMTVHVHTDADMGGNTIIPLQLAVDSLFSGFSIADHPNEMQVHPITLAFMQRLKNGISRIE